MRTRFRQCFHDLNGLKAFAPEGVFAFGNAREPEGHFHIAREGFFNAGAQHFYGNFAAIGGGRKYTCAMDAAAIGVSSKVRKKSFNVPFNCSSMQRMASFESNGGRRSCSKVRSAAMASPTKSERVDNAWPILMKLGPSSCI